MGRGVVGAFDLGTRMVVEMSLNDLDGLVPELDNGQADESKDQVWICDACKGRNEHKPGCPETGWAIPVGEFE